MPPASPQRSSSSKSTSNTLRVGVFGTGAIGGHVGGCLALAALNRSASIHVTFYCRPALHQTIQQKQGIEVTNISDEHKVHRIPSNSTFTATTEVNDLQQCDLIIVSVKSLDTEGAGKELAAINTRATIISLQNGVSNPNVLRSALPQNTVLAGLVEWNVGWTENRWDQRTGGRLIVEQATNASQRSAVDTLIAAWKSVGLVALQSTNIVSEQHAKCLVNLLNSVNALSGVPVKRCLSHRLYRHAVASAIEEGVNILKQHNIKPAKILGKVPVSLYITILRFPDSMWNIISSKIVKVNDKAELSFVADLQRNKPTEVDSINGEYVMLSGQLGMRAPINSALTQMMHQAERNGRPSIPPAELCDHLQAPALYNVRPSLYVLGAAIAVIGAGVGLSSRRGIV